VPDKEENILGLLGSTIEQHEGLEAKQTPFRITNPGMAKWQTMFDDTLKVILDPLAKKGKSRQNFLYVKNQEDVVPMIIEQLRRYAYNNKEWGLPDNPTLGDVIRKFDQTGAEDKLKFIEEQMKIPATTYIKDLFEREGSATPIGSMLTSGGR